LNKSYIMQLAKSLVINNLYDDFSYYHKNIF
jgi:hypothetical protein